MRRLLSFVLVVLGLLTACTTPALAEKRVALVMGNDHYANLPILQKAVNDAEAVGNALARLGFDVIRGRDLGRQGDDRQARRVHGAARSRRHRTVLLRRSRGGDRRRELSRAQRRAGRHRRRRGARARRLHRGAGHHRRDSGQGHARRRTGVRCLPRQSVPACRNSHSRQPTRACRREARARRIHALFRRHRSDRPRPAGAERQEVFHP